MDSIKIDATERSPELVFDFKANEFSLRGESRPKNAAAFYQNSLRQLAAHLSGLTRAKVGFTFEITFCDSYSVKVIFDLFEMLDATARKGNAVGVNWIYDEDDDAMAELGQELGDDLEWATFNLVKT